MLFAYDLIDPGSYLVWRRLDQLLKSGSGAGLLALPLELRPPPAPFVTDEDPGWKALRDAMATLADEAGIRFEPPSVAPWSRKGIELSLFAREKGCEFAVIGALFAARFERGEDLGRVDLLLQVAEESGLDPAEARTVLGVDRFTPAVEEARREAGSRGIRGVPTIVAGGARLEGFRTWEELDGFLRGIDLSKGESPDVHSPIMDE